MRRENITEASYACGMNSAESSFYSLYLSPSTIFFGIGGGNKMRRYLLIAQDRSPEKNTKENSVHTKDQQEEWLEWNW